MPYAEVKKPASKRCKQMVPLIMTFWKRQVRRGMENRWFPGAGGREEDRLQGLWLKTGVGGEGEAGVALLWKYRAFSLSLEITY